MTAEATSKIGRRTRYSRGTENYRAAELLREEAEYTNKVDIWALGCILHELVTSKPTFRSDWEIRERYITEIVPKISIPELSSEFLRHQLHDNIQHLLHREPTERPRASDLRGIFQSYSLVLIPIIASVLPPTAPYPTYAEWKQIALGLWKSSVKDVLPLFTKELLYQLAELYQIKGEKETVIVFLTEILSRSPNETEFLRIVELIRKAQTDDGGLWVTVLERVGDSLNERKMVVELIELYCAAIKQEPNRSSLRERLGDRYLDKRNAEESLKMHLTVIRERPFKFLSAWIYSKRYLSIGDLFIMPKYVEAAEKLYKVGLSQLRSEKSIAIAWSIFYAAAGDYSEAIRRSERLSNDIGSDERRRCVAELMELVAPFDPKESFDALRIGLGRYEPLSSLYANDG